jgi:hypothetical protein
MTEQQEEIFRTYGLSDEEIEKMKKDGLSFGAQGFVDTALMMLNYLEEKYDEKFKVVGGSTPGLLSDEYWIKAEACEGEYAEEKFDVYYWGEDGYTDGYIALLKQEEAAEALEKLLLSKFSNILIFSSISGEYGNELRLDNTGEEMLKIVDYKFNIITTDSELSEVEFTKLSKAIEKLLEDNNVSSTGLVRYLDGPVDLNMTNEDLNRLLDNVDVFRWNNYIRTDR